MNWKNDKWRLIVFLILIISGMLKMLGSKHSDSGMIELKESVQYCKNSIIDGKKENKDADKFFSILIKIPTNTDNVSVLIVSIGNHF